MAKYKITGEELLNLREEDLCDLIVDNVKGVSGVLIHNVKHTPDKDGMFIINYTGYDEDDNEIEEVEV